MPNNDPVTEKLCDARMEAFSREVKAIRETIVAVGAIVSLVAILMRVL